MKYFRLTPEYILWQMSWVNLNLLMATIPDFDLEDEDEQAIEKRKEDKEMDDLQGFFKDFK
jgi:hypothetical protein